jgi:hypothetical protein
MLKRSDCGLPSRRTCLLSAETFKTRKGDLVNAEGEARNKSYLDSGDVAGVCAEE